MTSALCSNCDVVPRTEARFCDNCGSRISTSTVAAEFKQVTILFADVVGSMQLAAVLDAERLRELMAEVFNRSATVVKRYGGTVDKFTGDGIMAIFGAPIALEDHAVRACLGALDIQTEMSRLAEEVERRDGIEVSLRIGLNSGGVIAGDIDSGPGGYTAVGAQVGLAQRMESVAPAGGVMLSESTARLVEHMLALDEPQWVSVKGSVDQLLVRCLLALPAEGRRIGRHEPNLVGRESELTLLAMLFDRAETSNGSVLKVAGSAGVGKSRIVREAEKAALSRGVSVFTTGCESHTSQVPFHVAARLLREVFGINDLDSAVARTRVRIFLRDADPEDLLLFEDLLGIGDVDVELPEITSEARQRRLVRLVKAAILARTTPALYVVEDVHWIDEVSEAMIAEFASVIPGARATVLITYRPEYRGALAGLSNAHALALGPLDTAQASALISELVGEHPSAATLSVQIADRAAGNPFFAQEIVRDLAERGVLDGERGAYVCRPDAGEVRVPATVQATVAARIDRLDAAAKTTLFAAAVIGFRFGEGLLTDVLGESTHIEHTAEVLEGLVDAELVDQVMVIPRAEYAFHHPLVRTVAYEAQLKSNRAELHRRLAGAIEQREPELADENAALIAEHLAAAGELHAAYQWHIRAGGWSTNRDLNAAKTNWQRAREIADQLQADDPARLGMRIAPRTLLCGNAWRIGGSIADIDFDELRELTGEAGDKLSLTIGMAGFVAALTFNDRIREAAELATECAALIESTGDPTLTTGLLTGPLQAQYEAGEVSETLRLADRVIELADGDPVMGNIVVGSPLALAFMYRGCAKMCMGLAGFGGDLDAALTTARPVDGTSFVTAVTFKHIGALATGIRLPNDAALLETAEALEIAEQSGDPFTLACALAGRGIALIYCGDPDSDEGYDALAEMREMALAQQFTLIGKHIADIQYARRLARDDDLTRAIELARTAKGNVVASGDALWHAVAATTLVQCLLQRSSEGDLDEALAVMNALDSLPTDPGFVINEIAVLGMRLLLARAQHDEAAYRLAVQLYRERSEACHFEGHLALSQTMD